jgi:RNA polymerase sigma-70 factor (ECF subfamily)
MPLDVSAVFEAHRARVYRWAYALCRRHDQALDIVQDVFLSLVRAAPTFDGESALRAWLRRSTTNTAIDRWRRTRRRRERSVDPPAVGTFDVPVEENEENERIRAAIVELTEPQRFALLCKICDEMTFREIASELYVAIPTAKTHYVRALEAVRRRLGVTHVPQR